MKISMNRYTAIITGTTAAYNNKVFLEYCEYEDEHRWKTNWCSVGAVDNDMARIFAENIRCASNLARMLNENEVEVDYDNKSDMSIEERCDLVYKVAGLMASWRCSDAFTEAVGC